MNLQVSDGSRGVPAPVCPLTSAVGCLYVRACVRESELRCCSAESACARAYESVCACVHTSNR